MEPYRKSQANTSCLAINDDGDEDEIATSGELAVPSPGDERLNATPRTLPTQRSSQDGLPTDAEIVALAQSGPLLRFASENIPNLDKDLPLAIAQAVVAHSAKQWTPEVSQRFWHAFNTLTAVIKPVTMDCLATIHKNIPRRRVLAFWRVPAPESLEERSSRRYTSSLIWLLVLLVPLQLVIWVYTNLSSELDGVAKAATESQATLLTKCQALSIPTTGVRGVPHKWTNEENASYYDILRREADVRQANLQLFQAARLLGRLIFAKIEELPEEHISDKDWFLACQRVAEVARERIQAAAGITGRARLMSSVLLQFVLPILLGTIGAIAYILRSSSEQIRTSTFSTTTPIRNLVRVALGALMGVVIGLFSGLSAQITLPPLALAFLAGYGVEAVFSIFDGFIERLKEPSGK